MKHTNIFAVIILCILFSANLFAQETIRVDTDLVSINVAVRDANGKAVRNLTKEQFEIFDNRAKQTIAHFSAQEAAVSYGIVYDMHPTTEERTNAILESLRQFTKQLSPAEDFFVTVFNERGNLTTDFVPNAVQIKNQLEMKEPRSLYDAISQAAEKLRARRNLKQTLIVISDGADHNSHHSYGELTRRLRGLNAQIYAVLLDEKADGNWTYSDITREDPRPGVFTDANANDRAAIGELTLKSGGATFPETAKNRERLYSVYKQIAAETKEQYTLGFYPSDTDGKWHTLSIRLLSNAKESKKFVLTYRQGYQSPAKK